MERISSEQVAKELAIDIDDLAHDSDWPIDGIKATVGDLEGSGFPVTLQNGQRFYVLVAESLD